MFKRILVTINGSKEANYALKKAIELAKEQKATLRVIHVIDHSSLTVGAEGVNIEALRQNVLKSGETMLDEAKAMAKKERVDVVTKLIDSDQLTSKIEHEVLEDAKRWRASLIVIGTHGRRGVARLLLGSIAEEVMRNTTIPVLLFRLKK